VTAFGDLDEVVGAEQVSLIGRILPKPIDLRQPITDSHFLPQP
jgi:hypothetical protein